MNTPGRCFFLLTITLGMLFSSIHAQQRTPKSIDFDELREYLDDFDKRRAGERIVVNNVPLQPGSKKHDQTAMTILEAGREDDSLQLFTSATLAKRLQSRALNGRVRLRLTCTVIELRGEFDVSLSAFVTKAEAINEDGSVVWTTTGTAPARVKYRI